jgi:hypothetical protein
MEKYGSAEQATDASIIRSIRIARWITKAADTSSEYVILLLFHELASILRYRYIASFTKLSYTFNGKEKIILKLPLCPDDYKICILRS